MDTTNPAVPGSLTPNARDAQRRADALSQGTANNVAIALTGATVPQGGPFVALANFGQTTLGAAANIPPITSVITANSAAIQALQAQDAADSNNGVNVFCDFSTYADATSLTNFAEAYNPSGGGTLGISGGYAVLQTSATNFTAIAQYSAAQTNTDYQIVTAIYRTAPAGGASNLLIGRCNAAATSYVYAAIASNGSLALHTVVAGVDTEVASLTPAQFLGLMFYPGAPYALTCGVEGSVTTYTVSVNGAALLDWVDSSNVTGIGASYRYCGFGLEKVGGAAPSSVAAFGFVDDAPAPLIGSVFRAYSTSAAVTVASSSSYFLMPNSFYDTVEYASSDYTYAAATANKLTIGISGVYLVKFGVALVAPSGGTSNLVITYWPALYRNGSVVEVGQGVVLNTYGFSGGVDMLPQGTFLLALTAGDYIQPGYSCDYSSGTATIEGDGVGLQTMFSCALVNTGKSG